MTEQNQDQVVLVDSQDVVLGTADKVFAHRRPAQLHRAISVWMLNERGELLFQQRSIQKLVGGGWWGNTVCGNVWPNESYRACALRRLKVELGIESVQVAELVKFEYQTSANDSYNEHELDQLFISRVAEEPQLILNPAEVSDAFWVDKNEFFSQVDRALARFSTQIGQRYPTAAQSIHLTDLELQQLTPPLELELADRTVLTVPWTLVMAQLTELRAALQ